MHLPSLVQTGVWLLTATGFSMGGYLILADVNLGVRQESSHSHIFNFIQFPRYSPDKIL